MRLIGGSTTPCVDAAARPTFVQNPSTSFGVTRTNSTGGNPATYSDQLPKSVSDRTGSGAAGSVRVALPWPRPLAGNGGFCAA